MIWAVWWDTALNEIKCEVKLKEILEAQQGQLKLKNKIWKENQKFLFLFFKPQHNLQCLQEHSGIF